MHSVTDRAKAAQDQLQNADLETHAQAVVVRAYLIGHQGDVCVCHLLHPEGVDVGDPDAPDEPLRLEVSQHRDDIQEPRNIIVPPMQLQ